MKKSKKITIIEYKRKEKREMRSCDCFSMNGFVQKSLLSIKDECAYTQNFIGLYVHLFHLLQFNIHLLYFITFITILHN